MVPPVRNLVEVPVEVSRSSYLEVRAFHVSEFQTRLASTGTPVLNLAINLALKLVLLHRL
jgi:hypothetical protein